MAFWEQIGKKITDAGQGVAQQTKNLADIAKLNSAIYEKEKRIASLYSEIGKAYYENHKDDAAAEEASSISELNKLFAEVKQHKSEIGRIKGVEKCPHCGAEVAHGSAFCNSCGKAFSQSEPTPVTTATDGRVCPSCKAAVPEGNLFCNNCGTKIETNQEV